jgi:hypothetical protein
MNPDVIALLPLIAPVATFAGVLFSNRHVDTRIADVTTSMNRQFDIQSKLIVSESARLEASLRLH